jgi:hypothetical protein
MWKTVKQCRFYKLVLTIINLKQKIKVSKEIRLIGNIILIAGIIVLLRSQLMEITVAPDYAKIDIDVAQHLPEKIPNIELIADKTNYTLLGGFLIIVGLQLSLVSNKILLEIKEQWKDISSKPL